MALLERCKMCVAVRGDFSEESKTDFLLLHAYLFQGTEL
jgi:hypothetical protein